MSGWRELFATKPVDDLIAESEGEGGQTLRRAVGAVDLTALGIGAIIGTGIFVILGEAVAFSGPAIVLSFVLAGVTCAFSALSYAELSSSIPVSGSAYTFGYATLGEFVAWIIGWDLILEYGLSVAAVAVGWGGYLQELLGSLFSIELSKSIAAPPGEGGEVNLPALFLVLAVAAVLIAGVRESVRANSFMVLFKVLVLLVFIAIGVTAFDSDNLTPFFTNGYAGVEEAAALIFFAYIGFDAVSTSGEEAKKPGRDLPIAIIGSLAVATVLYIAVSIVATAAVPLEQAQGLGRPPGGRAQRGSRDRLGRRPDLARRHGRDHQRRADDHVRADADRLRDEP